MDCSLRQIVPVVGIEPSSMKAKLLIGLVTKLGQSLLFLIHGFDTLGMWPDDLLKCHIKEIGASPTQQLCLQYIACTINHMLCPEDLEID